MVNYLITGGVKITGLVNAGFVAWAVKAGFGQSLIKFLIIDGSCAGNEIQREKNSINLLNAPASVVGTWNGWYNEASLIRLMGSVLRVNGRNEHRQGATRIFRPEKYKEILISTIPDELKCIAEEQ